MGRLSKDKRDVYYREAKNQGFRARSAFKLLQIDQTLDLLTGVRNVADLCAAPGGWSQVLALRLLGKPLNDAPSATAHDPEVEPSRGPTDIGKKRPRIVAVDMYEMQPIDGVVQVVGDITDEAVVTAVLQHFEGENADLVVCDGAPDVTQRADFDEYVQHQLVLAELRLAAALLRPGGVFVAKMFRGEHAGEMYALLLSHFDEVLCCKPRASRNSSVEVFVVCRGFRRRVCGLDRSSPLLPDLSRDIGIGAAAALVPFVACGGEDDLDADTNYPVEGDHLSLQPVAPPIRTPYTEALEDKRGMKRPATTTTATACGTAKREVRDVTAIGLTSDDNCEVDN